jgi:hypothetical protein
MEYMTKKKQMFGFASCVTATFVILLYFDKHPEPNGFPAAAVCSLLFFGLMGWFLALYNFWSKK